MEPIEKVKESFPMRLAKAYGKTQAGLYAGSLAFTMFMSMFPLILGVLSIAGFVMRDPSRQHQLQETITSFFPADARQTLITAIDSVREHAGILGIIGVIGLAWSGSAIFTTMEAALDRIFGARPRDFLRQRAMALGMTIAFVPAIIASVFLNSLLAFVPNAAWLGPIIGAAVWITLMLVIYRVVPNCTFRVGEVWRGAVLAGVLMEALTLLWPLYTKLSRGFSSYGATFALFFLLATWLYFMGQFMLLGAVANRILLGTPDTEGVLASPGGGPIETDETRAVTELSGRPSRPAPQPAPPEARPAPTRTFLTNRR